MCLGTLFLILGVGSFIGGAVSAIQEVRRSQRAVRATGVVINMVTRPGMAGKPGIHCPVVEFTTAAGERIEFESDFGTSPATHAVGEPIAVRYDPALPKQATLDSIGAKWFTPVLMTAMGLLFMFLGVVFLAMAILWPVRH